MIRYSGYCTFVTKLTKFFCILRLTRRIVEQKLGFRLFRLHFLRSSKDPSEAPISSNMDSTTVTINDPRSLTNSSATGSTFNYGTLQLSSSSDLQRELRRRGRSPPRSVTKTGENRFQAKNIKSHNKQFLSDLFTSLLEVQWGWTLFAFCFIYFGSWTLFAGAWYGVLYFHGDLDHADNDKTWKPCVSGIHSFTTAFLFSVETQHTTGYGYYHLGDECPDAIILMCMQSIVGVILEGLMVGLVFIKMSRAKKRSATLMFSKSAAISQRDGQLCFMFRVADIRTKSHLLQAKVRAQLVRKRTTLEGEVINYHQEEMTVQGDEERDGRLLLLWPATIVHTIDLSSPLQHYSPPDFNIHNSSFEIIVVLEGIVESTGLTVQVRSSYLPHEILWGHRFESLQSSKSVSSGERIIDYALFHNTYPVSTTTLSGAELNSVQSKFQHSTM